MKTRIAIDPSDRLAVMEIWHAATKASEPLAYHQALRLPLLRRHQGTWWLGEEDGRVVSSLLCYPLRFDTDDEILEGYGLGAVATRPEARRRGHAAALCRAAIERAESEGRSIGLLFSAIPPAYYERLGFRVAPAWRHVCRTAAELAASGSRARLVPLDPRRDVETLLGSYQQAHAGLHVFRDEAEWAAALTRNANDLFFGLGGAEAGYVRVNLEDGEGIEVVELMVPAAERASALRAVAALADAMGRQVVEGWFDPVPEVASFFPDEGRATTRPMVRGPASIESARFWGSDYF